MGKPLAPHRWAILDNRRLGDIFGDILLASSGTPGGKFWFMRLVFTNVIGNSCTLRGGSRVTISGFTILSSRSTWFSVERHVSQPIRSLTACPKDLFSNVRGNCCGGVTVAGTAFSAE